MDRTTKAREQRFIVYDGRADEVSGTDDAQVMVCESSLRKALSWDAGCHVWAYDVEGDTLINERYIGVTGLKRRVDGSRSWDKPAPPKET